MNLEERFWSKVNILGEDDCWEWQAGLDSQGYGAFKYEGKKYDSNRMTWFIVNGEFPKLLVCHTCDNRKCCNPKHLFLGTYQDNHDDMVLKGRHAKGNTHRYILYPESIKYGEKNPSSKLTSKNVIKLRKQYLSGDFTRKELSKIYGVGYRTICQIVNRETWQQI